MLWAFLAEGLGAKEEAASVSECFLLSSSTTISGGLRLSLIEGVG